MKDRPEELRGKNAERTLTALMLAELREQNALMTEFTARLGSQIQNNVLEVATRVIPATGVVSGEYGVAAGCIVVDNLSGSSVTVSSAGPQGSAPISGIGVTIVPAGVMRVVNLASRSWSIYGTAGDTVTYQVLTRGGLVGGGLGAVDGGAP